MKITRYDPHLLRHCTRDLPVTEEQMAAFNSGTPVTEAFPDLDADQQDFILTGMTNRPAWWPRPF